ncbi:MAG: tryptophan--tRNA ligase [Oscillospiraceae bacterium]|nr:tryptophan--tRNA ligase [Oscillospiraceae bacterium]
MKKRLLSGLQPSGELTIGNYCGSIRQFLQFQKEYDSFLFIPDMHSITVVRENPDLLRKRIRRFVALYLASGLDANNCTFYIQSEVSAHNQLAWVFECLTCMGELSRMTQFKDKSTKLKNICCGLFTYPLLMAADILLYDAHIVPVGSDQKQHIELTRSIAQRFNHLYKEVFLVPKAVIPEVGAKIKDLQDPEKKMSKSNGDTNGSIFLLDDEKTIRKKISRAITDSEKKIYYDKTKKPGISNLITIYSVLKAIPLSITTKKFKNMTSYGDFKQKVIDAILETIVPIQEKYYQIEKTSLINEILDIGKKKANQIASAKYEKVRRLIGFGR